MLLQSGLIANVKLHFSCLQFIHIHLFFLCCRCDFENCGKAFKTSQNLKSHKKRHTGLLLYSTSNPEVLCVFFNCAGLLQ